MLGKKSIAAKESKRFKEAPFAPSRWPKRQKTRVAPLTNRASVERYFISTRKRYRKRSWATS